jgi:hypothetical protein
VWSSPRVTGRCRPITRREELRLTSNTYQEVEVTDVEREGESTEMVDNKGGEDDQQNRHEDPKQPPEEARHTASNTHGGQLPINSRCMQAIARTPM